MYNLSSISKTGLKLLVLVLLLAACKNTPGAKQASKEYYIHAVNEENTLDTKMADYLKTHLKKRCKGGVVMPSAKSLNSYEVAVGVKEDLGADYQVKYIPSGVSLIAKDERTLIWLLYQFIKREGITDSAIAIEDLPPCIFPKQDTTATFPFEYRDIYTPSNQNHDVTQILGLHNIEVDWGLWGHQMENVLGTSGQKNSSLQNMDRGLFATVGGITKLHQFCFSSEKLYDLTVKYILEKYGDGSTYPMRITIAPNDNSLVCTCRRCEMAGNTPTNATPAVTRFIERLAERFPNHMFFTTAYSSTSALPGHKLPKNVGVLISAMDYPRIAQSTQTSAAQEFFHKIEQWKTISDNVYIWDYICNFDDFYTQFPILLIMKERLLEYNRLGVKGVFLNGSGYFYSLLQEAYCFTLSQMMLKLDSDPLQLVKEYFDYSAPHIGNFIYNILKNQELYVQANQKELPMYGGMTDILNSYIREDNFVSLYKKFLDLDEDLDEYSPKELAWFKKIRQAVSYTFMEIGRKNGIFGEDGFAEIKDGKYQPKEIFLQALDYLRDLTDDDELFYLTSNERAAMDHMDRINEEGVYIGDYQRECDNWLNKYSWAKNLIIGEPLQIKSGIWLTEETRLTDGVMGISQNYHWGWAMYNQENLIITLPADKIQDAKNIAIGFLNLERHRMSPPVCVDLWVDDELKFHMKTTTLNEYYDEGEVIILRHDIDLKGAQKVELRFEPSQRTKYLMIDEILVQ